MNPAPRNALEDAPGGRPSPAPRAVLRTSILVVLAAALLALPAAVNGFPLIFFDSSGYLNRASAVTHEAGVLLLHGSKATHSPEQKGAPLFLPARAAFGSQSAYKIISHNPFFLRPITYSILLLPFATNITLPLLPFAQGLICAYVIMRLFKLLIVFEWRSYLIAIFLLTIFSSLPLHVAYVMPDVFGGVLIVLSFVVVAGWARRSVFGRLFDVALLSALIATHLSYIPITLALLAVFVIGAVVRRGGVRLSGVVFGVATPLAIAIAFLVASNIVVAKKAVVSESSPLFLLARLVGDGPARDYLRVTCPSRPYLLCGQQDRLAKAGPTGHVSDFFLWDPNGAVAHAASPKLVTEAAEIDKETIEKYPVAVSRNMALNGMRQLIRVQPDVDLVSTPTVFEINSLKFIDDGLANSYLNSWQGRGAIPLQAMRGMTIFGLVAAVLAIGLTALVWGWGPFARCWGFLVIAAIGIAANALTTGGLSEVHDRYGNRVIWLLPLAALVLIFSALQQRRSPQDTPRASTDDSIRARRHVAASGGYVDD